MVSSFIHTSSRILSRMCFASISFMRNYPYDKLIYSDYCSPLGFYYD